MCCEYMRPICIFNFSMKAYVLGTHQGASNEYLKLRFFIEK